MIFQKHNFKNSYFDKYSKNIKLFKFKMDLNLKKNIFFNVLFQFKKR